jgi:hypothetical protein
MYTRKGLDRRLATTIISNTEHSHPDWAVQLHAQGVANLTAIARGYPFSWLPQDHILNWIRRLENA